MNKCLDKKCPVKKICNPKSGKCVLKSGKLGKTIYNSLQPENNKSDTIDNFPTLYSIAANGSTRFWRITVSNGLYTVEYGVLGGKITTTTRECTVKNIGKINQTTLYSQALSEARRKWIKKLEQGYTQNIKSSVTEKTIQPILPMLAQKYDKSKQSMKFPCSVQPKLDGVRALYYNNALWSRQGKKFAGLDHILSHLTDINIILDGELYSDTLTFQEIISAIKKQNINTQNIMYIVYDLVNDMNFPDRYILLKNYLATRDRSNIKLLDTFRCNSSTDVYQFMQKFIKEKYEGLILRSDIGPYTPKYRSKTLQKYKEFIDQEYKIVGFTDGKGADKGLIIFECEYKVGKTFKVRPVGTKDIRRDMFLNGSKYIGQYLTVKYQELTDGGAPRFPIGLTVRNYE